MRGFRIICAWVALAGGLSAPAWASGRQQLQGHVPAETSILPRLGPLDNSKMLHLAITLPWRHPRELQDFLKQINDPQSPLYRHYLTPQQFAENYGPSESDYQAVMAFARSKKLDVLGTSPNRVLLEVSGTAAQVQSALNVRLSRYRRPDGSEAYAPENEPSLDLDVPLAHICGLDNLQRPRPMAHIKDIHHFLKVPPSAFAPAAPPMHTPTPTPTLPTGSAPSGLFWGTDFRNAYAPSVCLTGTGQSVALVEFEGYYATDIQGYESLAGLPNVPLLNVPVDGFKLDATDSNGIVEVSLDIEMVISMAPGLSQVVVYEEPNGTAPADLMLNQMATDDKAKQISCSWTGFGDSATTLIFQEFAAQGQSFFQAAGDYGAYVAGDPTPTVPPPINLFSQIQMTVVGGTELRMNGASYVSETTWNEPFSGSTFAGGGGVCSGVTIPSYQQTLDMTANGGSTIQRNIPDVSMNADNDFVTADQSYTSNNNYSYYTVVGTSAAAPLWAGFLALANQQAKSAGVTAIPFINPTLYSIGQGTGYAASFHDITTGNNNLAGDKTHYPAVPGYDLATGWGSPTGQALLNALTGLAVPTCSSTPTPTPSFTSTPTPTSTATKTPTGTPTNTGTPSATPTNSRTATASPTATSTSTFTRTSTASSTPSSTASLTGTSTSTGTPTPTASSTPTATFTATLTSTLSATNTPTDSMTPTATDSASPTKTGTSTATPSATASQTPTASFTPTGTSSPTPTASASPSPTSTATTTPSPTATPSSSPTGTPTSSATPTATRTSTSTSSETPTDTATSTFTASSTSTPTGTATPTSTGTPTASFTSSPTPTSTPTSTDTWTSTFTASNTPTLTPTNTATSTGTSTPTPTPTNTATDSASPTNTGTSTATSSPTYTATSTGTSTPTPTPTNSATLTPTPTDTPTASFTSSPTSTSTATSTATLTSTSSATNTATSTGTSTPTPTPTNSATLTATSTGTPTASFTSSPTSTSTATPTATLTSTSSATHTATSTGTSTPTATSTNSATDSTSPTNTGTSTATPTSSPTLTATPSPSSTPTATSTVTLTSTSSATNTPTDSMTPTPTHTSTSTATATASLTASATASSTPSSTPTLTSTSTASTTATSTGTWTMTSTPTLTETSTATGTPTSSPTTTSSPVPSLTGTFTPSPVPGGIKPGWAVYPNPSRGGQPIHWKVVLAVPSAITLSLYDLAGELVYQTTVQGNAGTNLLTWNLENQGGQPVAQGLYVFELQIAEGFPGVAPHGRVVVLR